MGLARQFAPVCCRTTGHISQTHMLILNKMRSTFLVVSPQNVIRSFKYFTVQLYIRTAPILPILVLLLLLVGVYVLMSEMHVRRSMRTQRMSRGLLIAMHSQMVKGHSVRRLKEV